MFRSSLVAGWVVALALTPAAAQQPTQAQRDAIRASCRSDFMANCAGVQPGGKEAPDCLLRNEAKLSASCRSAVNAIATAAPTPAATAPAAATSPAATSGEASPAAPGQSSRPAAAAPSSTKTSHPASTRKTSDTMRATTTAVAPTAPAPTAAPAVAPLGPIRPMLPRRALMILAQCRPDQERLCAGVPAGGGEILSCLAANAQQLSPTCYAALARVSE